MATPRRRRVPREQRRSLIIAAARDEFLGLGLQGARTKGIAERAGVNEALLYQHFASKDELFQAAVVEPLEQALEVLEGTARSLPFGAEDDLREHSRYFFSVLIGAMRESFALLGLVLFSDRVVGEDFYRRALAPILEHSIDLVNSNLESWEHRPFDPEVTVPAQFGMCWFLALDAAYRGRELDVDDAAEQVVSLFFDGLSLGGDGSTG